MDGLWAALRAGQWVKNVLLAAPLVLSHQIGRWDLWVSTVAAIALFSMAASSVYLVNDILDLPSDRKHAVKKKRPLAAGRISLGASLAASAVLTVTVLLLSSLYLSLGFLLALGVYLALAHSYSLLLKKLMLVDVFVLAVLYSLRVLAGGQATGIEVSYWLLALIVFLFVSLAFAKRCAEIRLQPGEQLSGRGYAASDLPALETLGAVSGYVSVLVLALYINSQAVTLLYPRPWMLWPVCLLLMFWISRVWLLVRRGRLHDDPLVFFSRDGVSYAVAALAAALGLAASL